MKNDEIKNAFDNINISYSAQKSIENACLEKDKKRSFGFAPRVFKPVISGVCVCALAAAFVFGAVPMLGSNDSSGGIASTANGFSLSVHALDANGNQTETELKENESQKIDLDISKQSLDDLMVMFDGGGNETGSLWTKFDFICKGENIKTVTYSSDSYYFAPMSKNEDIGIDSKYIVDTPDKSDIAHSCTVNYDEQSTKPYQIGIPQDLENSENKITVTVKYTDGTTESRDIILNGLTLTNSDDGSLTINAVDVTATVK